MAESDLYRCQILTFKVDHSTERIQHLLELKKLHFHNMLFILTYFQINLYQFYFRTEYFYNTISIQLQTIITTSIVNPTRHITENISYKGHYIYMYYGKIISTISSKIFSKKTSCLSKSWYTLNNNICKIISCPLLLSEKYTVTKDPSEHGEVVFFTAHE